MFDFGRRWTNWESAMQRSLNVDNRVLNILKNLPVKYRDVSLLKYSSRLENKEIAAILRITEGTVRQRIARGKVMIEEALKELGV